MLLSNFISVIQKYKGEFQFSLNDEPYVLTSMRPKVVNKDAKAVIFSLHKNYTFTNMESFNRYCMHNLCNALDCELLFEIDGELYDFTSAFISEFFMSSNLAFNLKKYTLEEDTTKEVDYLTLHKLSSHARAFGIGHLGYDFNNAKIIVNINGVAHQLKPEDIHFTVDEVKGKEADYSIIMNIK